MMNRIDELIKEKCPNGIGYKKLYEITIWDKKFNGTSNQIQPTTFEAKHVSASLLKELEVQHGDIKLLSTGKYVGYTNDVISSDYINEGEVITIPSGGSANMKYHFGKYVDSGNILATTIDEKQFSLKYVYYVLLNMQSYIETCFRGSGVKHPDMIKILNIKIPIPPIEVQEEIVRILDKFGGLEAELEAELEARQSQYEFWRGKIFDDTTNLCCIGELLKNKGYIRGPFGSALVKSDMVSSGVPVYEQQHAIYGHRNFRYYITFEKAKKLERFSVKPNDLIISCSGTVGKVSIISNDDSTGIINQALLILRLNNKVLPKYVKYYLESPIGYGSITSSTNKSAQVNIANRETIEKIKIPVPPLEEQEK